MAAKRLSSHIISDILSASLCSEVINEKKIAIGVSGGPDSMALCYLLSQWAQAQSGIEIHAVTVDHALRVESEAEALHVKTILKDWPCVHHKILRWEQDGVSSKIQEQAREARYSLMRKYCTHHEIQSLFLAHHMDDQAETFLFRLAKGSGLDGLSCMSKHAMMDGLNLYRPFLDISKSEIIDFCESTEIQYIEDPSNHNNDFARVRLRQSQGVLEKEGLTNKRLSITVSRISRARHALEVWADRCSENVTIKKNAGRIEFNVNALLEEPEEIVLRILIKGLNHLCPHHRYGVRMEKIERLTREILEKGQFRKQTLGGVVFEVHQDDALLILTKEK